MAQPGVPAQRFEIVNPRVWFYKTCLYFGLFFLAAIALSSIRSGDFRPETLVLIPGSAFWFLLCRANLHKAEEPAQNFVQLEHDALRVCLEGRSFRVRREIVSGVKSHPPRVNALERIWAGLQMETANLHVEVTFSRKTRFSWRANELFGVFRLRSMRLEMCDEPAFRKALQAWIRPRPSSTP